MTYPAKELSVDEGSPIELYDFAIGADTYRLTTDQLARTFGGNSYTPVEVSHSEIRTGPEDRAEVVTVNLPARHALVQRYINGVPGQKATLTLRRIQRFDTDLESVQLYKGVVRSVAFSENGVMASVSVMPLTGSLARNIPRYTFAGQCPHVLYDNMCGAVQAAFTYAGTVSAESGDQITVPGLNTHPDGWANAGFVLDANGDYRMVISHVGNVVRILLPFFSPVLGTSVSVVAGCGHDRQTCHTKFNRGLAFGGYEFVPLRNPFQTGLD